MANHLGDEDEDKYSPMSTMTKRSWRQKKVTVRMIITSLINYGGGGGLMA